MRCRASDVQTNIVLKESHPIISVQNVCKQVNGNYLLKNISFSVYPKEVCGIIGHSGSGKTTLLRCLDFLELPSSGAISIAGFHNPASLKAVSRQEFAKKVAYISQNYGLFSTKTVLGNITYPLQTLYKNMPLSEIREKVHEMLHFLNLYHKKDVYPGSLSGGQKQKVAIARALICEPQILLCDEITSALDPRSTEDVVERLLHLNESMGITLVLVSHELDVVKYICSHTVVLHNGGLEEFGETESLFLKSQNEITKELFHEPLQKFSLIKSLVNLSENKEFLGLGFPKELAMRGIISHIAKTGLASINILSGNVYLFRNMPVGFLNIVLEGTRENRIKVKRLLIEQGVIVKEGE